MSAENLAAVLAHVASATLFHGPGTENSVQLSAGVEGYDYVLVCLYATWNGQRQYDYVGACPASTVTGGGTFGITKTYDGSGSIYPSPVAGSMTLEAEPSGTRLTLDPGTTTHHYFVTDVVGVRVRS